MQYRSLGRSGIQVSPLCLGTMMFGNQTDETTARQITDRAFEQGINFIDTANVYNDGKSEEVVGRLIAGNRDCRGGGRKPEAAGNRVHRPDLCAS
jgi:aryl-alcohol dehydrogenase-like predicted oxidoreductase